MDKMTLSSLVLHGLESSSTYTYCVTQSVLRCGIVRTFATHLLSADMKTISLILSVIFIGTTVYGQTLNSNCYTPEKIPGVCISIKKCPSLVELLQTKPLTNDIKNYARQSQCGYDGRTPLGCCPQPHDVTGHRNLGLINEPTCGIGVADKIRNGNLTKLFECPWMVLLQFKNGDQETFGCGGSLINKRYILTAAHCVTNTNSLKLINIRIGEHDTSKAIDCENNVCSNPPQDIPVDKVTPHPKYSITTYVNDIALIRLKTPVSDYSDSVRPICLPVGLAEQAKKLDSTDREGKPKKLRVTGWGITQIYAPPSAILLKVNLPIVPNNVCASKYKPHKFNIMDSQMCAGGGTEMQDSCSGDSGGPLTGVTVFNGAAPQVIQYGVVSFGPKNCGTPGFPGVYTRTGFYMEWILDTIYP